MMGSGKTTVGSLLAAKLRATFFDTDHEMTAASGMTVAEMFETASEPAFRATESETLARVLVSAGSGPAVVAAGGGAVIDDANRDLMRRLATVVWLRTSVGTLTDRLGTGEGRPLLDSTDGVVSRLKRIDEDRAGLYESAAHIVVDTDGLTPESVADAVAAAVAPGGLR
jgi:shikimate kinase